MAEAEALLNEFFLVSQTALEALKEDEEWDLLSLLEKRDALITRLDPLLQDIPPREAGRGQLGAILQHTLDVTTRLTERIVKKRDAIGLEMALAEQTTRQAARYLQPGVTTAGAKLNSVG